MPVVGYLTAKIDARKLLVFGFLAGAFAMYDLSVLSLSMASSHFWPALLVQGFSLGFIFVPLTTATNDPIPLDRMGNATSIFNLMRNIGASIGISIMETMQVRKMQMHINVLGVHVNRADPATQQTFRGLRAYFMFRGADPVTAAHQAYAAMWGTVQQQAAMLAYNDSFRFLAGVFVVMIPFVFWMKRPKRGKPMTAH
jgi:MFS transporter, DHA2 family, multidrug resistance protein